MDGFTTTLAEIKSIKPKTIRTVVREMALTGLSLRIKLPDANKVFEKPRVQFLYIHHVFDDEIHNFDKLLNELSLHHTFISYSEAVQKILTGKIDKPYISISSDDGFKNNLRASKVLEKYNVKGCFFINPDTIGMKDYSKIKTFCKEQLNFPPIEFMDWNDIHELLSKGHEVGSHTIGHVNVAATNLKEVEDNLYRSYEIITKKCGSVEHFAFPYGRFFDFNKSAYELVFQAGYKSCASAERGCHISSKTRLKPQELFIRRDHVICDWNINHIKYFIFNNSINSSIQTSLNPYK